MKLRKLKNKSANKNNILFLLMLALALTLTVGYSAFASDLTISGEATFRVQEDIRITGIELYETTNSAIEEYNSRYAKNTINVGINLKEQTSTITYKVTIANTGSIAMWIDSITNETFNNDSIEYTLSDLGVRELIHPGEVKTLDITFKYKDNVAITNTILDARLFFKFMKPESILATPIPLNIEGSEDEIINEALNVGIFNGTLSRLYVESINFSPTLDIGENAIGHWDASERKDGSVIAWYTDNDNNGLYELTIGGNEKVIFPESSYFMFAAFVNLKSISFDYVDTSRVKDMSLMFAACTSLTNLNLSKLNTSNVTNMMGMFAITGLSDLDLSPLDTSKVTNMSLMFVGNQNLSKINFTNFNTDKVTDMSEMFEDCSSLIELDLSTFNTSNVTNMLWMFLNCYNLTHLKLFNDTSSVINMRGMFKDCQSLTKLDLSKFKTTNVIDMSDMFYNCSSLKKLNLSTFDTTNVTSMYEIFYNCESLMELDIRSFDKILGGQLMFLNVPKDIVVYVKDENIKDILLRSYSSYLKNIIVVE